MRTIVVIFLSLLVLIQSAGIGVTDILLFGRLVNHAEYHSENYGDDLFTFFEKHYGDLRADHQKNHNEDEQEHQRLPFQHISHNHLLTEMILFSNEISITRPVIPIHAPTNFHYQNLYSSLEKSSIFQPPKFV